MFGHGKRSDGQRAAIMEGVAGASKRCLTLLSNSVLWCWAIGIILLLIGIIFNEPTKTVSVAASRPFFLAAGIELLKTIGVALLGVGLVNLLLETHDWTAYFERRLKAILIDQDYIKSLDTGTLERLFENLLKAEFKDAVIDSKAGFLGHFNLHLKRYLACPFREHVKAQIAHHEHTATHWKVIDNISYTCKSNSGRIQDAVSWSVQDFIDVISIKISVTLPESENSITLLEDSSKGRNHQVPLSDYQDKDGLTVNVRAEYLIPKDEYLTWKMSLPSTDVTLSITYPVSYKAHVDTFSNDNRIRIIDDEGLYQLIVDTWILPENGFVWRLNLPEAGTARNLSTSPEDTATICSEKCGQGSVK